MNYELLANIVMVMHVLLIAGVFAGILISVRYKRFRPIESLILILAVLIWSLYGGCPLTYLENFFRIASGHPLPVAQVGFISFYFNKWFNLSVTNQQLTVATYITALLFILTSIKWLSPFINFEIIKVLKSLTHRKSCRN